MSQYYGNSYFQRSVTLKSPPPSYQQALCTAVHEGGGMTPACRTGVKTLGPSESLSSESWRCTKDWAVGRQLVLQVEGTTLSGTRVPVVGLHCSLVTSVLHPCSASVFLPPFSLSLSPSFSLVLSLYRCLFLLAVSSAIDASRLGSAKILRILLSLSAGKRLYHIF